MVEIWSIRGHTYANYTTPRTKLCPKRVIESIFGLDIGVTTIEAATSMEDSCHQAILRFHHLSSYNYRDCHKFLVISYNLNFNFQGCQNAHIKSIMEFEPDKVIEG